MLYAQASIRCCRLCRLTVCRCILSAYALARLLTICACGSLLARMPTLPSNYSTESDNTFFRPFHHSGSFFLHHDRELPAFDCPEVAVQGFRFSAMGQQRNQFCPVPLGFRSPGRAHWTSDCCSQSRQHSSCRCCTAAAFHVPFVGILLRNPFV